MANDLQELKGTLFYSNFDEAMLESMGADFLSPLEAQVGGEDVLVPVWQVEVPGVCGTGQDQRVVIGFDIPESIFNQYVLPGINIKRTTGETDRNRQFAAVPLRKYRYPAPEGNPVEVEGRNGETVTVATHYRERRHAEPENIFYDIEIRARAPGDLQNILRFIRNRIQHRMYLPVRDSIGDLSYFTVFRETSGSPTTQVADILDRFRSIVLSYRVEGQIDDYNEYTVTGVRSRPFLRISRGESNG